MQNKAQKAVIYLIAGLGLIIVLVVGVNFLQRNPNQENLNTMLGNSQYLTDLIESVDTNRLNFQQRTWSATAKQSLRTDIQSLQAQGAEMPASTDNADVGSGEALIEAAVSLLGENNTQYQLLDSNERDTLEGVFENQTTLLETAQEISR